MKNISIIEFLKKCIQLLNRKLIGANFKKVTWKKIEYFDEVWKERIEGMSKFIPTNSEVLDLGCGKMWLKDMVQLKTYYPVDYCDRGDGSLICDFNLSQFPDIKADVAFVSGVLEYVVDVDWFIRNIATNTNRCIISYNIDDESQYIVVRKQRGWVNNLTKEELIAIFQKNNFKLIEYINTYHIFIFDKK